MIRTCGDGCAVAQVEGGAVVLGVVQRPAHLHAGGDLLLKCNKEKGKLIMKHAHNGCIDVMCSLRRKKRRNEVLDDRIALFRQCTKTPLIHIPAAAHAVRCDSYTHSACHTSAPPLSYYLTQATHGGFRGRHKTSIFPRRS